jgi:uncharacterized protein (UPF0264 family)
MEPISTAIAAVTAASNAVAFIKARLNDVQSVSEISDQISTLFSAQKKLNEERNKQAGVGDIHLKSSIDAVLESKRLQEQMQEVATMINMRWPKAANQKSTWQEILDHHNQALRDQKEAIRKAQIEARRKQHEMETAIKTALSIAFAIAIGVGLIVFLVSFAVR